MMVPFMPPKPPDDPKYLNAIRWLIDIHFELQAIKWVLVGILVSSMTTCVHTCETNNGVRGERILRPTILR